MHGWEITMGSTGGGGMQRERAGAEMVEMVEIAVEVYPPTPLTHTRSHPLLRMVQVNI